MHMGLGRSLIPRPGRPRQWLAPALSDQFANSCHRRLLLELMLRTREVQAPTG
jgi:hypothetical protein